MHSNQARPTKWKYAPRFSFSSIVLLGALALGSVESAAQSANQLTTPGSGPVRLEVERPKSEPAVVSFPKGKPEATRVSDEPLGETSAATPADVSQPQFRMERMPLVNGAELLTIFGRLDGMRVGGRPAPEVPLVSVVRDTLGDNNPENDRLRYVWMLTYSKPTLMKRLAAAVPFLYQHVGNKTHASGPPAPIIDLANTERQTWNEFFQMGLQHIFLDTYGLPLKISSRSYLRNSSDYRRGHVTQALAILSNYENLRQRTRDESEFLASQRTPQREQSLTKTSAVVDDGGSPLLPERAPSFTVGEMLELRARLIFSGKTLGGLLGPDKYQHAVEKRAMDSIDMSGHNWEMLRQRAEAEGLYFDPLTMPDGTATHAILWISKADLATQDHREFNGRFLNIANPWNDKRLRNWSGYSQTRYFDANSRSVTSNDPQAQGIEMVPLALYGLNHPKIPALLIDFRDSLNPKTRELSRRVFQDLTKNVFSLSSYGNFPYFLGRTAFDFVTGRRGMDMNQPSRLRSYSELKLLLSFNGSIDPALRTEIERRVETVSVNPLANDNKAELRLARQQYDALIDFARRPDGLPAKIESERRAEMVSLEHGRVSRFFFNLGNAVTFGRYVHREVATPELDARMEMARRVDYHTRFLQNVARSTPQVEVVWSLNDVRASLQFLVENGAGARGSAARAAAAIFQRTSDEESRRLCLDALYKINDKTARNELLSIYRGESSGSEWRQAAAERLRKAVSEDPRIKPAAARAVLSQVGTP